MQRKLQNVVAIFAWVEDLVEARVRVLGNSSHLCEI